MGAFKEHLEEFKNAVGCMVDSGISLDEAVSEFRIYYSITAYKMAGQNQMKAARMISTHRNTLNRHLPREVVKLTKRTGHIPPKKYGAPTQQAIITRALQSNMPAPAIVPTPAEAADVATKRKPGMAMPRNFYGNEAIR